MSVMREKDKIIVVVSLIGFLVLCLIGLGVNAAIGEKEAEIEYWKTREAHRTYMYNQIIWSSFERSDLAKILRLDSNTPGYQEEEKLSDLAVQYRYVLNKEDAENYWDYYIIAWPSEDTINVLFKINVVIDEEEIDLDHLPLQHPITMENLMKMKFPHLTHSTQHWILNIQSCFMTVS